MKRYSTDQFLNYVRGCLSAEKKHSIKSMSSALHNAKVMLEDGQDGIEAVEERNRRTYYYEWYAQGVVIEDEVDYKEEDEETDGQLKAHNIAHARRLAEREAMWDLDRIDDLEVRRIKKEDYHG